MKNKLAGFLASAMAMATATGLAACGKAAPETPDVPDVEGIYIQGETYWITRGNKLVPSDSLLCVTLPEGAKKAEPGASYKLTIGAEVAETAPPRAKASAAEFIRAGGGVTKIPLGAAVSFREHLPLKTHLIDVRTPGEFSGGHVPGAVNVPLDRLTSSIGAEVKSKDDVVIVYCRSGARSANGASQLEQMGFKLLFDAGGIMGYKGEIEKP